jgi:hypothetical protein
MSKCEVKAYPSASFLCQNTPLLMSRVLIGLSLYDPLVGLLTAIRIIKFIIPADTGQDNREYTILHYLTEFLLEQKFNYVLISHF